MELLEMIVRVLADCTIIAFLLFLCWLIYEDFKEEKPEQTVEKPAPIKPLHTPRHNLHGVTDDEANRIIEAICNDEFFFDGKDFYLPEQLKPTKLNEKTLMWFYSHRVYFHPLMEFRR